GLVGYNWGGSVASCYSTGTVTAPDYVGGLVGYSDGESSISTSYSVVRLTAPDESLYAGGLVGDGTADNSYFLAPPDGGGPDNGIGVPLTDGEMKQQASFAGWDFSGTADDGEADLWFMPENAYPILIWQADTTDPNDNAPMPDGA
ncbi:MAG: GLUG motif-containing protein, partial [Phycisphaerales bacterium]